jgi:hypothetical protein
VELELDDSIASGEELEIGSVIANKLVLTIQTSDEIASNAKIVPEVRLNGDSGYSEWIKLGSFYIDNRTWQNGVWKLTAYDKLITTTQTYVSALTYPETMKNVLTEICTILGVTLDTHASSEMDAFYEVPYEDADITIRDMLSYIASANAACVKITPDETLDLIILDKSTPANVTIPPSDYERLKQTNPAKTYTRVKVTYNSDGEYLESGTGDDDHTLSVYNPFATQDICDDILYYTNGLAYTPLDMPWKGNIYSEPGDKLKIGVTENITWAGADITWDGATAIQWDSVTYLYTYVLKRNIKFKGGLRTNISSPSKSPQKSEFNFKGNITTKVEKIDKTAVKQDTPYNAVRISKANGIQVFDADNNERIKLGNYTTGKYGLRIKNKTGTATVLDEDGILQSWGDSQADNVDATHRLKLKFYIPTEVISVKQVRLNFSLEAFRAYETGAASGGGFTASFEGDLVASGWVQENAGVSTLSTLTSNSHTHGILNHNHQVGFNHSHSVGAHYHDLTFGIYESTSATGVKVFVDGTLRLDNGGSGYATDQANLDITSWVTTSGWHTVEFSSTQLGRINAAYFMQVFLGV